MVENKLQGVRILVTRAEDQADSFASLLRAQGATTIEKAVLSVAPATDYSDLDRALKNLEQYQWIIFASQNAVKFTVDRFHELGLINQSHDSLHKSVSSQAKHPLNKCQIASIGSATSQCLNQAGINVTFQPSTFVAENFISEFLANNNLAGQRVLWPKTNIGRRLIAEQLEAAGAVVDTALAYESGLPANQEQLASELVTLLKENCIDIITLASAQTARNLGLLIERGLQTELGCLPGDTANDHKEKLALGKEELLASVKIAAIGPITAAVADECLGRVDLVADEHTLKGLTEALLASLKFEQNH